MRLGTETACCAPICRGLEIFKSKKFAVCRKMIIFASADGLISTVSHYHKL